jgi:hypothetical protein
MRFGEAEAPEREDAVGVFARLVEACERHDVTAAIRLRRILLGMGFRVEPVARKGGGR